jgi:cytidylate kinase
MNSNMVMTTKVPKQIVIAVDGYSSSGKSTMAKALAKAIGYRYIDSGAMYRAVTLWALRHDMISNDSTVDIANVVAGLTEIKIDFIITPAGQHTTLNGEDVEQEIRSMRVSQYVSLIAAIPAVRHALVAIQQKFGEEKGIVMDGRDIGTTVFPHAELKIFVNASAETRAQRRFQELLAKGATVNYEEVLANVVHRDHIDETRDESPLRKADDAILLDNSNMTEAEQNEWMLSQFNKAVATRV